MSDFIFNEKMEKMPRAELKELQLEKLRNIVKHAYDNVPFYKNGLDQVGVSPSDIKTLEDIQKIPFTVKNDLRDNYPFGLMATEGRGRWSWS